MYYKMYLFKILVKYYYVSNAKCTICVISNKYNSVLIIYNSKYYDQEVKTKIK